MGVPVRRLALTHAVERLRLATPFRISGYTFSEGSVALVTLTDDGLTGRGEANGVYYFNDDAESDITLPDKSNWPVFYGINPAVWNYHLYRLPE